MKIFAAKHLWFLAINFLSVPSSSAFGFIGHYIVGEVVQKSLSQPALNAIQKCGLLHSFNGSMGSASVWADTAKYTNEYSWTRSLHYFDVPNDPPSDCKKIIREEGGGWRADGRDLLSALNNFTQHGSCSEKYSHASSCPSQLQFNLLLHLLQDLHQPLHLTGKARGGNSVHVIIKGRRYTLHGLWDTGILDAFITNKLPVGKRNVKGAIAHFFNKFQNEHMKETETSLSSLPSLFIDWANEVSLENCRLLWRYNLLSGDEYMGRAMVLVEDLILKAVQRSVYVLDKVLNCEGNQLVIQPDDPQF